MKITVKLEDPSYCVGCPCNIHDSDEGDYCSMFYWDGEPKYMIVEGGMRYYIRPQECIDDNGKK
jgi:hypothetical protein